ncbi:MAG: glucuronate isomerase [Clostridia bacterium]|nr:glucuronate isomerase [Clostridia bacterium]
MQYGDGLYRVLRHAVADAPFSVAEVSDESNLRRYFSNVYELIAHFIPEIPALMRMCGVREEYVCGEGTSDYEKFSELCRISPMLAGNCAYIAVCELLIKIFDCNLAPSEKSCMAIWQACCGDGLGVDGEKIIERMNVKRIFVRRDSFDELSDGERYFGGAKILSALSLDSLADTENAQMLSHIKIAADIESFARERCDSLVASGGGYLSLTLPWDFEFVKPSVYGVEQALNIVRGGGEISKNQKDMLAAQVLRCFVKEMRARRLCLLLDGRADGEMSALLEYLHGSVGLADVLLCVDGTAAELKRLICQSSPDIIHRVIPAGFKGFFATDDLRGYASAFPIEKLPHLGLLARVTDPYKSLAAQCALRRELCKILSEGLNGDSNTADRARVTAQRVCYDNFYNITEGDVVR